MIDKKSLRVVGVFANCTDRGAFGGRVGGSRASLRRKIVGRTCTFFVLRGI